MFLTYNYNLDQKFLETKHLLNKEGLFRRYKDLLF